ncbi:MAG: hypothetical protein WBK97_07560 [Bacteroidales bacterium]|jgi:hypothetical protein
MNQKREKNDFSFPLEYLHAEAFSETMPSCTALIVFTGTSDGIVKALKKLYRQSQGRVFYTEDPLTTRLPAIITSAEKSGIPLIVLHGEDTPSMHAFLHNKARISLISRGTEDKHPIEDLSGKNTPEYMAWIGFQRYLTHPDVLHLLSERYVEVLRLGTFRENPLDAEPLLREATHHFLDLRAVRNADLPDGISPSPNGLYAEELCTLARYMGLSQSFHQAVLYGYPSGCHEDSQAAQLLAQVLWHITEGLAVAVPEHPQSHPAAFLKKAVQMGEDGREIVFLQSGKSGRWWIEVPNSKHPAQPTYIACSINDYALACKGEIPMKWLFYYQKSNNFS